MTPVARLIYRLPGPTPDAERALIIASAGNNAADLDRDLWPDEEGADHRPTTIKISCESTNVVCVSATGPTSAASASVGPPR